MNKNIANIICSMAFIMLLAVPMAFAQTGESVTNIIIKQGVINEIKMPCFNSTGSYCDNTVKCNLTLNYPNSSVLIKNAAMTNQLYYNNYTLSEAQTQTPGIYSGTIACKSPTQGSGFSTVKMIINKDGVDLTGNMTAIVLVGVILLALLIFFIVMAIILEANLKLVFAGLSFVMLPIVLYVSDSIIQDALMPAGIISMVGLGFTLSLYMLGAFILYVCYKLTMQLKIKSNKSEGAKTIENIGNNGKPGMAPVKKEEQKTDYEDDESWDE